MDDMEQAQDMKEPIEVRLSRLEERICKLEIELKFARENLKTEIHNHYHYPITQPYPMNPQFGAEVTCPYCHLLLSQCRGHAIC